MICQPGAKGEVYSPGSVISAPANKPLNSGKPWSDGGHGVRLGKREKEKVVASTASLGVLAHLGPRAMGQTIGEIPLKPFPARPCCPAR